MHPIRWVPADGGRHATADVRRVGEYVAGENLAVLCGSSVTIAAGTELHWLWPTCAECYREARVLVDAGAGS